MILSYLLQIFICLGISYLLYRLILQKETSFTFNRYYLLISLALSLTIPILNIAPPKINALNEVISITETIQNNEIIEDIFESTSIEHIEKKNNLTPILIGLYIIISLILVVRFLINLIQLSDFIKNRGPKIKNLQIVLLNHKTKPFTFFNYLFVNISEFNENKIDESVIIHEKVHSDQLHTIDILFIEIVCCIFWIIPFTWLFKKAISENHEYLADKTVIDNGFSHEEYAQLIFQSLVTPKPVNFLNGFSFIQTKNRIVMLNKSRSSIIKKSFKILSILSLLAITLSLNSFNFNKQSFTVVLDAGHGGKDNGALVDKVAEKDINLLICKKIATINMNKKINFVLTRDNDNFISLNDRVNISNSNKADMFISIHCNNTINNNKMGIEAYYCNENSFSDQSLSNCRTLLNEQLKYINENAEIKSANYMVLKNTNCPSVLMQVGFLSNIEERTMLQKQEYQNEIAEAIYDGLLKIINQ